MYATIYSDFPIKTAQFALGYFYRSKPLSRVLSWTAICLGLLSPTASCGLFGTGRAAPCVPVSLASGGVYMAPAVTGRTVGSCPTFPPLPADAGGLFLLHYP